jgi:N-methylhydantoinase A
MLLGVDVGGTFTDAVLVDGHVAVHTAKVPTTPSDQSVGVLAAVQLVLSRAGARPRDVERFAHGMTVATNAMLEGATARTALIATAGFTDVIELARQARAHLYRLCQAAPPPLVPAPLRFGAPERMGPDGPLQALAAGPARALVQEIARARPQAVAVSLLHAYADPAHERLLAQLLAQLLPDVHVSLSSELVGTFREYERTATTVIDAALSPLLADYLRRLSAQARAQGLCQPQVMQSSGGLTDLARASAHAALTVLSGPAGGANGALLLADLAREADVLCLDMGGTSCDVCLIHRSQVSETAERLVAGRPLALPALDIHTVGAGGGSIAWRDPGGALRVGPSSAGAEPGPACYGRGGAQPTVTDANLLLGRLLPDAPLAGQVQLDRDAAQRAVGKLARELGLDLIACAEGIVRVAEAEMLGALRVMTVQRGIDPRDFALMPFGGAGPLHAAALASELGISRVLCPRACGVLCALGLAAAAPRRDVSRTLMLSVRDLSAQRLCAERQALVADAAAALSIAPTRVRVRHELRYRGQSFELPVEEDVRPPARARGAAGPRTGANAMPDMPSPAAGLSPEELCSAFAAAHEQRYGYRDQTADIELVNMRASVWGPAPALAPRTADRAGHARAPGTDTRPVDTRPTDTRPVFFNGRALPTTILRGEPQPGTTLSGPALCALPDSTVLVPPGWGAEVDSYGTLLLRSTGPSSLPAAPPSCR